MTSVVEAISKEAVLFGESPLWDNRRGQLVFTDCWGKAVNIFDPTTRDLTAKQVKLQNENFTWIGVSMPFASSTTKFLVTLSTGKLAEFDWDKGKVTKVMSDLNNPLLNYEDAKCDVKGRLWTGTARFTDMATLSMVANAGEIYKLCKSEGDDGTLDCSTEDGNFDVPNGLGFNKEHTKLFWNDLTQRVVNVFDFDANNGKLANRRFLLDYKNHAELEGSFPDGLCVDINGNVWVANWKGGSVIHIDGNTGKLLDCIPLPVSNVTSVCFGGTNYDRMYVTTTSIHLDQTKVQGEPDAGKLFQITRPQDNSFRGFQEYFMDL